MKSKIFVILLLNIFLANSQNNSNYFSNTENSNFKFKTIKNLDANPVNDQGYTGTCWSFCTLSFFESELLRKNNENVNLSEMFIVRNAYIGKAINYLRMNGKFNFSQGGAFHDIPWVMNKYGVVTEEAYQGLAYTEKNYHNHSSLADTLTDVVEGYLEELQTNKQLPENWLTNFENVLDSYLGDIPTNTEEFTFTYNNKEYTPKSFANELGLDMDDYICLTSYLHQPFFEEFILEVPDNWALQPCYNIPLDQLMSVMEKSIMSGYSFAWGADVSEEGFSFKNGLAINPVEFSEKSFSEPTKEKWVTAEERQMAYDIQTTTDDHGMHITGICTDQNNSKYFIVKNSWGDGNYCKGYLYASFPYARYKTMNIMVHKDAISNVFVGPISLKKKLNLK